MSATIITTMIGSNMSSDWSSHTSDDDSSEFEIPPEIESRLCDEDDNKCELLIDVVKQLTHKGADAAIIEFSHLFHRYSEAHPDFASDLSPVCQQFLSTRTCRRFLTRPTEKATHQNLPPLWFIFGVLINRLGELGHRLVSQIDEATFVAIKGDRDSRKCLQIELDTLSRRGLSKIQETRRRNRLLRLIAGKTRMIRNQALKVDLLYSLVSKQSGMQPSLETSEQRLTIGHIIDTSMWDSEDRPEEFC